MKTKNKRTKSKPKKSRPQAAQVPRKASFIKYKGAHSRLAQMLVKKREDILNTVKQKDADVSTADIGDELDVASQTFEREMMFELTNGERVVLDDIEAALRKIEKGEFGFCESCRKKIPALRMHAMPWARYCIHCQSRTESQSRS